MRALVAAGTIFGTNGLWLIPLTPDLMDCDGPPILLPTTPGDAIDFAGSIVVAPPTSQIISTQAPGLFIRQTPDAVVVYWSTNYRRLHAGSHAQLAARRVVADCRSIFPVGRIFRVLGDAREFADDKIFPAAFDWRDGVEPTTTAGHSSCKQTPWRYPGPMPSPASRWKPRRIWLRPSSGGRPRTMPSRRRTARSNSSNISTAARPSNSSGCAGRESVGLGCRRHDQLDQ